MRLTALLLGSLMLVAGLALLETLPPENWREKSFRVGLLGYSGNGTGVALSTAKNDVILSCVISGNLNAGKQTVEGYDLTLNYRVELGDYGKLSFNWDIKPLYDVPRQRGGEIPVIHILPGGSLASPADEVTPGGASPSAPTASDSRRRPGRGRRRSGR